jgi:hypothetical protein
MHTANPTGTHNDPFDLGAVLVIDTAAANAPRRCETSDGSRPPAPRPARALRSALM